ncbi:MAG TPA: HAMP domain-containing sensor histidine kinase [Candidatus Saccharimonadales bacterium]
MRHPFFARFLLFNKRLGSWFYALAIKPQQADVLDRNRELVLNVLLTGTLFATTLLLLQLVIGFLFFDIPPVNAIIALVVWLLVGAIFIIKRRSYLFAARALTAVYLLLATLLLLKWGSNLQFALLLLCLVIVLAGILLSSRHALYATGLTIGLSFLVKLFDVLQIYSPNESWLSQPTSFGEVAGYSIILFIIGITSWLFGRQTERSFARAQAAEAALLKEQAELEAKIKERTLELQVAQFEEMQQFYRFAEVGQLTAALLHDLANHLAILTLDIEGLHQKQRSRSLDRARRSILYLDDMVDRLRQQLQEEAEEKPFNIASKVSEVVRLLRPRAIEMGVTLEWKAPSNGRRFAYVGDSVKFSQIIAVVINNAIEAYQASAASSPVVAIHIKRTDSDYIVTVKDYGKGVSKEGRKQLFKPFLTTKKKGMGIGLFIARRMLEKYFKGTIQLEPAVKYTQFSMTIPASETRRGGTAHRGSTE